MSPSPEFAPPAPLFSGDNYTVMVVLCLLMVIVGMICLCAYAIGHADRRKQIHLAEMEIDRDLRVAEIQAAAEVKVAELEAGARERVAELESRVHTPEDE